LILNLDPRIAKSGIVSTPSASFLLQFNVAADEVIRSGSSCDEEKYATDEKVRRCSPHEYGFGRCASGWQTLSRLNYVGDFEDHVARSSIKNVQFMLAAYAVEDRKTNSHQRNCEAFCGLSAVGVRDE
jgi:hypothetical protein